MRVRAAIRCVPLAQELRIRGLCAEVALSSLGEDSVAAYLESRFPVLEHGAELATILRRQTEGNPLFMRHVVNSWLDHNWVEEREGRWLLRVEPHQLTADVPADLRHLIEQQIEELAPDEQNILETASVVGVEFSAAAVSSDALEDTEILCAELARQGRFLASLEAAAWPDGTLSERFRFTHHLYQEVLYARIPAGRCARLHRQIGERLEAGYGPRTRDIASELAAHFGRGRDAERAARYSWQAAESALGRSAYREAIEHLQSALKALQSLPDTPERTQREVSLHCALAGTLVAVSGWQSPEVERAYERADALSQQLDAPALRTSVLYGLAFLREARGDYEGAEATLKERLHLLTSAPERVPELEKPLLETHELLACSLFHQGYFESACAQADEGLRHYSPHWYSEPLAALGENAGVGCHGWAALSLWYAGRPDEALRRMQTAVSMARLPNHDFSLASATSQACVLHQLRGEIEQVAACAESTLELAHKSGFAYRAAIGDILQGWTLAASGQHEKGIARLQIGVAVCRSSGAIFDLPYFLALHAQACGWAGRTDEGQAILSDAQELLPRIRPFFFQPELFRLRGELLLRADAKIHHDEAVHHFRQALDASRALGAKALELRAATSLYELTCDAQDGRLLAQIYASFSEGFTTADLQRTAALLRSRNQQVN
jgi:tetratricopeptide (TPR) repeat protein